MNVLLAKKGWIGLGVFVYLLLVVGLCLGLLRPQRAELARVRAAKKAQEEDYIKLKTMPLLLGQLRAKKNEVAELVAPFRERLQAPDQTQLILGQLDTISKASGMKVQSISPLAPEELKGGLTKFSWKVTLAPPYQNLPDFLYLVESSSNFLGIDNLDISSGMKGRAKSKVEFILYTFGVGG